MKNMLKKLSIGILLLSALFSFSSCDPTQLFNPEPAIIQINFDPAPFNYSPELTPGQRVQMNWIYLTSDGYTHDVSNTGEYSLFTVTSSDPNVCYFLDGYLIALNPGSVIITIKANNGGAMQYIDFYVKSGRSTSVEPDSGSENPSQATYTASSIDIDTTSTSLVKGESFYINYSVYPYYANDSVTCSSSDPSVVQASVYYNGCIYVYAVDYGTATITIKSNDNPNVTAKCKITVNDGYNPTYTVSSVTLSDEYLFLDINETAVLTASIYPSSAPSELKWESSKPEVVSVSSGKITALKAGTAIITATSKDNPDKSATCEVTVSNNKYIQVTGLSFTNTSVSVGRGEETTVTVNVQPSNANPKLTWYTSSSSSYFTYSPDETNPAKCKITGLKEGGGYLYVKLDSDSSIYSYVYVTVTKPTPASANQYFWGTWIRMDKGTKISVEDTKLINGSSSYDISKQSTKTQLIIDGDIGNGISSFEQKSQNVIIATDENDNIIPFYRQGGTNLDYTLKVVGSADLITRAASGLSGLKVRGTSNKYKSFVSDAETTTDGSVTLKAPVQGDIQTVSIELPAEGEEEAKSVVVENLKIENSGDYMGTVALVGENDYSLKITGTIDESEKTDGYLYAGHTYNMHLEIRNISNITSKSSILSITPAEEDDFITITSTDIDNLKAYTVSSIKPGQKFDADIQIHIGNISDVTYKDTKINIKITQKNGGWIDYVPIRIFREQANITFNAGKAQKSNASLNGFLIYPDGNSKFFTVKQGTYGTITVPRFKATDKYTLVFSGATVDGDLSSSTELYYTVSLNDTPKALADKTTIDEDDLLYLLYFGEENESEDEAFPVNQAFEGYIGYGDTDFYTLTITD